MKRGIPRVIARRSSWAICSVLIGLAVVALAIYWARTPPRLISAEGELLGRLPYGVRPSNLNLLVITLDTTRADRIGAYGWSDSVTPTLDRIAREGVLFERAIASAPLTLPAHSSLFTGNYPPRHGVRDNGGFYLDDRQQTLARRLRARGFKTGGFVGAYVLDRRWGISQGFDTYVDDFEAPRALTVGTRNLERPGNEVADRALEWLESVSTARFFGWVHFYDPHVPYSPPEPYHTRFRGRPYLGEIAFVDSQVHRILTFLEERDLLKKTIVVAIGDHGESLGEHGEDTHGFFAYDAVVRMPFMILAPFDSMRGRRIADVVRSIDLMPTMLELLDVGMEDEVDGRSLSLLMNGSRRELGLEAYSEAVYPRYHYGWSDLRAITSGRFKYIEAPRPELYDLVQDPNELHNLYESRRPLADRMASVLRVITTHAGADLTPATNLDPDVRARLAALGYVGTFVTAPISPGSPLADPKDKIELFNLLITARELLHDDANSDRGLDALRQVVAKDPDVIDAWLLMGNEFDRRRRFDDALAFYKRALALKPDSDLAVFFIANLYRSLGRDNEAIAAYRQLLQLQPRSAQAHQQLAELLIRQGELAQAEQELKAAMNLSPGMPAARNSLGALRLKQGDLEGGEREIREALREHAELPLAHFNLALVLEQRGDVKGAIAEYRAEVAIHPGNYMAQFNLGKLYQRVGDRGSQIQALRDAIENNPRFAAGYLFLAKAYLDAGQLDEATTLARRGIDLAPRDEWAPLGHFVLADIYSREGRPVDAAREAMQGRMLEQRVRR